MNSKQSSGLGDDICIGMFSGTRTRERLKRIEDDVRRILSLKMAELLRATQIRGCWRWTVAGSTGGNLEHSVYDDDSIVNFAR